MAILPVRNRLGYGAMQLAGPNVFGPPRDRDEALRVLRRAVELGVDHLDTSQYYGPDVVNELQREALYPYDGLHLVSKVGPDATPPAPGSRGVIPVTCARASRTTCSP